MSHVDKVATGSKKTFSVATNGLSEVTVRAGFESVPGRATHRRKMPSMYSSQFTSRKWHTGISTVVSFPNEPEGERLLCVGNKAIIEKKYEEALRLYADGLAIARGVDLKATLISNRCSAFAYQEKWAEALVLANECVALRPDWPRAYFCQGSALEGVGSVSEALRAYEKALSLDPEDEVRLDFVRL